MCLGSEIAFFIVGIYYLITGKAKIDKTHEIKGISARVMGLICMAVLPLALMLGIVMGFLVGMGALPESALSYGFLADALAIIIVAVIGTGYYYSIKENVTEITPAK